MNINVNDVRTFEPLAGSRPVSLYKVTGCRWPVGHPASHDDPQLFCNETCYRRPSSEGRQAQTMSFCECHYRLAYIKTAYVKMPRSIK